VFGSWLAFGVQKKCPQDYRGSKMTEGEEGRVPLQQESKNRSFSQVRQHIGPFLSYDDSPGEACARRQRGRTNLLATMRTAALATAFRRAIVERGTPLF